jgi:site-specific DNA-methyltransferase (adenine-specific)
MQHKAVNNRTLVCDQKDLEKLSARISHIHDSVTVKDIDGKMILGDIFDAAAFLPNDFVDLLILDPPYNLSKNYNGFSFQEKSKESYQKWFQNLLNKLMPLLKKSATIYVCSDWKTSILIAPILESHFHVRNRITWEREKGRGAQSNWKNTTEDIWFCTVSDDYHFDVDAVKLKRKVLAPYKVDGKPKDWNVEKDGNYRLTYPSNLWTDITIPFWSMPENTDHPTQKPEKLIAKLILASSKANDFVFDPFSGSGTTAVVAKKLDRKFCGVEINREYCCWALKRLEMANTDLTIQGYTNSVFWERNSFNKRSTKKRLDMQN